MKNIDIGNSGIKASEIGLGCMRMASVEKSEAEKIIKTSLEEGINFFDHADIYGEENQKKFLQMQLKWILP